MKAKLFALVVAMGLCVVAKGDSPQLLLPGQSVVMTFGNLAWLIHAPAEGTPPVVIAHFRWGGEWVEPPVPPVPPVPISVSGVLIIENQEGRTKEQAAIVTDPQWQTAAKKAGLTWRLEDRDHPSVAPMVGAIKLPLPVVVCLDADGEPVKVVPLPESIEEMRNLIGELK